MVRAANSPYFTFCLLAVLIGPVTANATPICESTYHALSKASGRTTKEEIDRLEADIESLPQPVRAALKRSLKASVSPIAGNAEPWQIGERVDSLERTRSLTNLWQRLLQKKPSPAQEDLEAWINRSLLRHGLMGELERRGLTFNPEEKSRIKRFFLALNRSRALGFVLNPSAIPSRDVDQIPPEVLESLLTNGLPQERAKLTELFQNSPARFHKAETALRRMYTYAFQGATLYQGTQAYLKSRREQQESEAADQKAREEFFRQFDELEKGMDKMNEALDKLESQ